MNDAFDLHEHRHELKQLRDSGETKLFGARDDLPCPACGDAFARLFLTRKRTTSFPRNDGARFCLLRREEEILMFRH